MHKTEIGRLDSRQAYWIPVVISPERDWPGAPGSRRGGRYMIDGTTFHASREAFQPFDSRLGCLSWIMEHRAELNAALPGAQVRCVRLDLWLLGMA